MFSGIVEAIGFIKSIKDTQGCLHVTITPKANWQDLHIGDSIAINGVCLTITELIDNNFSIEIVPETLRVTTLKTLAPNNKVNLERSLKADSRIGGHYVQGHVDGLGEIIELQDDGKDAWLIKIKPPSHLTKYIVNKGYIGIDGMSITIIAAENDWFSITLIPHTREFTIANQYQVGTKVNLEVDILSKYVEKLLARA